MANKYGLTTDRTQDHVDRLKKLRSIGWNNMTDSQKTEYKQYASQGAYNYENLNYVEAVVWILSSEMGLDLTTKKDWDRWTVPIQSQMDRYLGNVRTLINKYAETHDVSDFPPLPDSMNHLTWEGANNIEECLTRMMEGIGM